MEIIYAVFAGSVIREWSGKKIAILHNPFYCAISLPRPEVVCIYGFDLSSGALLIGGVGLGSLSSTAVNYLGSEG